MRVRNRKNGDREDACPTLFCALIDPGADNADLFRGEFGVFLLVFGRGHEVVFVAEEGDVGDEEAVGAFAGLENFAVDAAFERAGEGVEAQLAFGFQFAVAINTGFFEKRFDVFVERQAFFIGRRREFADVDVGGGREERNRDGAGEDDGNSGIHVLQGGVTSRLDQSRRE